MTALQITGLAVILLSVLLINLAKYRSEKKAVANSTATPVKNNIAISKTAERLRLKAQS
jgi:hypothetical protein